MKWYKRYPEFSRSPEVFHISPLAHLIYTVLCDLTAELDCEGVLAEKYITDSAFLARRLNMRLISLEEIERLGASHDDVLSGRVTHAALLSRCVTQLCTVGLLREKRSKEGDVCVAYEIPGFTADNQKYISDGTLRQRKHRESKDNVTHEALHGVTLTHEALLSRQEEKRIEEKRIDKKQKKPKALSPEKPATSAKSEKPSTSGFDFKALTARLTAIFEEVRGQKYLHSGEKDGVALSRLSKFEPDEIAKRWRRGLEEKVNPWLQVNTFAQLAHKFNDLGAPPVQQKALPSEPKAERPRGLTPAETAEMRKDQAPRPIEFLVTQPEPEYVPDYDIDGGIE